MFSTQKHRLAAFTLIEILVTVSLTAIIMLGITSLFITFIAVTGKARLSQNIRENGTIAMQKMIEELRSSVEIDTVCDGTGKNSLNFKNKDKEDSVLQASTNRISLTRGGTSYFLTSDTNQLRDLEFKCYSADSSKYIEISFTLASSGATSPSATHSQLDFFSGVALRN